MSMGTRKTASFAGGANGNIPKQKGTPEDPAVIGSVASLPIGLPEGTSVEFTDDGGCRVVKKAED